MTQALSDAIAKAAKLPDEEQDVLATILLEEIQSEARWQSLFSDSASLLEAMAAEAIQDLESGRVRPLDELQ